MQYLGGKAKVGKRIAEICQRYMAPGDLFVDMFCGSLNVVRHIAGPRLAIDACVPLITMWRAALAGWVPPTVVTRATYERYMKKPDPCDPMTAFVMFGCSFGGKWGAGYAKDRPEQRYAECASHGVVKKAKDCHGIELKCRDFQDCHPGCWPAGAVLYCDPPYASTTGYKAVGRFDQSVFWRWAGQHAKSGVRVFVSEYKAPAGWKVIDEQVAPQGGRLTPGKTPRVDRLFTHEGVR